MPERRDRGETNPPTIDPHANERSIPVADTGTATAPRPTLGLTGLTSNAMALIAPGAFLWLTYSMQSGYGKPIAGISMWFGIMLALSLCLATAIAYAELSKLYPGAGSSYFFAEQAFLSKRQAFKWARLAKFMVGWASHLYYWVYPGVMVGVTALVVGYMVGQIWPGTFSAAIPSPLFMIIFCVGFAFGVAYIAFRGVGGTTGVNAAINVIQITALIIFSVMAIRYRMVHAEGSPGIVLIADANGNANAYDRNQVVKKADPKIKDSKDEPQFNDDGSPKLDANDVPTVSYENGVHPGPDPTDTSATPRQVPTFDLHTSAGSVVHPHGFSFVIVQACVAILILVGFESVTAMGEEAKNAKRDIPRAVILSLVIQGGICYALEYFAANYFLHNNYTNTTAAGSSAPLGDMMQMVGMWAFGSTKAGWWFMMVQAFTVFLALVGTTLSCLSTGARVTYAMGRDEEVPNHFGLLHGKRLTPHRAIWTLAAISACIGIVAVFLNFCGPFAQSNDAIGGVWHKNMWYMFGLFKNETALKFPSGMLVVTLVSNFGTFLLYMMTCIVAIVAFREHDSFHGFKHMVVPIFGLLANFLCMAFYIVGPFTVAGMSKAEPFYALGVAALWGTYGAVYFMGRSKKLGKSILVQAPVPAGM
jgi:basic amino acid/polyamine antiporter, APA family